MKNLSAKQLKEFYLLKQKLDYIKQLKESKKMNEGERKNGKQRTSN